MDNKVFIPLKEDVMTLSETAEYLKVAEKTLLRMIHRNEIPVAKVGNQYRFLKNVLEDWLISKMKVLPSNDITRLIEEQGKLLAVWRLLDENLIITDMKAGTKEEALEELTTPLVNIGLITDPRPFIEKLSAREAMASTALERGIALPHLRKPEENPSGKPRIVFGKSKKGLDFNSPFGDRTYVFFLICTDSELIHLRVLSLLARILNQPGAIDALRNAEKPEDIISLIYRTETELSGGIHESGNKLTR